MIAIKKDFVPENTISYCNNRPLSSGKAYFLQDAQGNIHYAGKQCAEQNSHTNLTQIPDLTRALIANVAGHAGGHAGGHGGGHGGPNLGNQDYPLLGTYYYEKKNYNSTLLSNIILLHR